MKIFKNLSTFITMLKNLLPYLLLISVYFFFVNLEAQQEQQKGKHNKKNDLGDKVNSDKLSDYNENKLKISIPVIPYKE